MPTPVHARLRIGGTLYNDAAWSCGFNFATETGGDPFANGASDVPGALQGWADDLKLLNAGKVLPDAIQRELSTECRLGFIRCSRIGTDGKESDVALITLSPQIAMQSTPRYPAQTALVASLLTGRPGASYRGRVYWPALATTPVLGRADTDDAGATATGTALFLQQAANALQDNFPAGFASLQPVVVSNAKGTASRVTTVRVGNRFDSQRRRAEGQEEVYRVAPVPS